MLNKIRILGMLLVLAAMFCQVQADDLTASNQAELIVAINAANDETNHPGTDTITLTSDITLSEVNNNQQGANGLPAIISTIILDGNDFILQRDEHAPEFRLLFVAITGQITLWRITLQDGNLTESGGGIYNQGILILSNSSILNNTSDTDGAGIYNTGMTMIISSIIAHNTTSLGYGGGLYNSDLLNVWISSIDSNEAFGGGGIVNTKNGSANVIDSTFMNNNASEGAGISSIGEITISSSTFYNNDAFSFGSGFLNSGQAEVFNTTISGNLPAITGGGIYNSGFLTLSYSTIWNNSASQNNGGGGIFTEFISENTPGVTTVSNTIVGNSINGDCSTSSEGGTYTATNNLATGDCGDTPVTNLDPVLQDNGGLTFTHALLEGSNAINANGSCNEDPINGLDQRGYLREVQCDTGAFEFNGTIPPIELLFNGDFEYDSDGDKIPDEWQGKQLTGDKRKCNQVGEPPVAYSGECAVRFKGSTGEHAKLQQTIVLENFDFAQNDLLTLSAYVRMKGDNVKGKIVAVVTYADSGLPQSKISLVLQSSPDYTEVSGSTSLQSDAITKIKVMIIHKSSSGKVWIDEMSLQQSSSSRIVPLP
ncbi:MAG TPA: right-handed parallel beta-helix repeat-containing protein [Phototrophicaceae bacterium]|nr:right-handed parallel beta-helix repeat-containing protein [Phototrophicaceae bacterium]